MEQNRRDPVGPFRWTCATTDRKSTRLNSSHDQISYAVFCLKKKNKPNSVAPHTSRVPPRSTIACPVTDVIPTDDSPHVPAPSCREPVYGCSSTQRAAVPHAPDTYC